MPDPPSRARGTRQRHGSQAKGTRQPEGQFTASFSDRPVNFFRDGDGKLYTDCPLLPGPYVDNQELYRRVGFWEHKRSSTERRRRPRSPRARSPTPAEKLVAGAFESAAALARQGLYGSSLKEKELLDAAPSEELSTETVPHSTIQGSSSTVPFRCENHVEGTAESASAQTLQEPDVSSLEELLDTASLKASITTSPRTVPHNTAAGSPASASSLGSKIFLWNHPDWPLVYVIRMNRWGSFSMYPDLGGPFQSIDEAKGAINFHLRKLRCKKRGKMSAEKRLMYDRKYYADGTPKNSKNLVDDAGYLVQAVVDHHNDACNLFGNRAHQLERLLRHQWIDDEDRCHYHFNFTTKTKEADETYAETGNEFFAELTRVIGEDAWVVKCCCLIRSDDHGLCYGCRNSGSPDLRHPNNPDAYTAGHLDEPYDPYGDGDDPFSSSEDEEDDDWLRA